MKIPKSQSKTAEPCKLTAEMSQADASVFDYNAEVQGLDFDDLDDIDADTDEDDN